MKKRHVIAALLFTAILLMSTHDSRAQDSLPDNLINDSSAYTPIPLEDAVYVNYIGAQRLGPSGQDGNWPVISFLNSRALELVFDDLRNDYTEYRVDFVHCDGQWYPMDQQVNDYYRGFPSHTIEDVTFSSATNVGYATFRFKFPPEDEAFIQSGNYALRVFEADSDSLVLTRRFVVVDPQVNVKAEIIPPMETRHRNYKQELSFRIYDPKGVVSDQSALHVVATKNGSWDISCDDFKPSFVTGEEIVFENNGKCLFDGGNEYRDVNFIDFKTLSMDIVKVLPSRTSSYDLFLETDKPRSFLQYIQADDMNGHVRYNGQHRSFQWNELDYARLHFTLKTDEPMLGYEIYLFGDFSIGRMDTTFRMEFNAENGNYEKTLHLKQGLYQYQYVVKSPYQEAPDESLIEGSHYETENDYTLYIYYRSALDGYDRLLGIEGINSRKKLDD